MEINVIVNLIVNKININKIKYILDKYYII